MGYAIATAATRRGANVTLVSGKTNLEVPSHLNFVSITSAKDMYEAVTQRSNDQDIIIKAAAVADYTPANYVDDKIKKSAQKGDLAIPLKPTDDILAYLGKNKKKGQILCGFSMETKDLLENSRKKLEKKNLDMICANNLKVEGAGFEVDTNVLTLITASDEKELGIMSKADAANILLSELLKMRS